MMNLVPICKRRQVNVVLMHTRKYGLMADVNSLCTLVSGL